VSWRWEEIAEEWLAGAVIAVAPADIVTAFNVAERLLGPEWITRHRVQPGFITSGAPPTLAVVSVGQQLRLVEGSHGIEQLVDRLRRGDRSAFAELHAVSLCITADQNIEVEFEVSAADETHKPDFRLRQPDLEWVYVEVAAPDTSVAEENARLIIQRVSTVISAAQVGTALDVSFHRDPIPEEVEVVVAEMARLAGNGTSGTHTVSGLASIAINMSPPANLVLHDDGEPEMPRLGLAYFEAQAGQPAHKRVSVRYPFADDRAEAFLTQEARQLPREGIGVIMLNVSEAVGGFKSWRPLLLRRLQPRIHTRVGAICLFQAGSESTPSGEAIISQTSYIQNVHAKRVVPSWLEGALRRFQPASNHAMEPSAPLRSSAAAHHER
jgi:hypothetical protein